MRRDLFGPEERAAEAKKEAKDEAELLDWHDNRGGKDQKLHPLVEAYLRVARAKRVGYGAIREAAMAKVEAENAAARKRLATQAAKPAEPEVKQEQGEARIQPIIETQERKPTSIMEALNRPSRDYSVCLGESWGSWRR